MSEYIGFTGTQQGLTEAQAVALLRELQNFRDKGILWMHNGKCIGADRHAGEIWKSLGGKLWLHPSDILSKQAELVGDKEEESRPPLTRNRDILLGSWRIIACPKEMREVLRSGTWATIRGARRLHKPVMIIYPDGTIGR